MWTHPSLDCGTKIDAYYILTSGAVLNNSNHIYLNTGLTLFMLLGESDPLLIGNQILPVLYKSIGNKELH